MLDLVGAGLGVALVPASTALLGIKGVTLRPLKRASAGEVMALLRRKVFFMAGLYGGGARYDVQFDLLADFSERASDPAERERRIRAAVEAYVAHLEALCRAYPYNWFNFHDFWLEDSV